MEGPRRPRKGALFERYVARIFTHAADQRSDWPGTDLRIFHRLAARRRCGLLTRVILDCQAAAGPARHTDGQRQRQRDGQSDQQRPEVDRDDVTR